MLGLLSATEEPIIGSDGQPVTVTVYSPGSKAYAKAQAAQQNRMIDKLKKRGKSDQTAEEKARELADHLTACTASFSDNFEYQGLEGAELIRAVYMNPKLGYIAEQVGKHIGDWSNFSKPATTS